MLSMCMQAKADMKEVCWIVLQHEAVAQNELLV